ncbi:MAG: TlpA family protein disulfide reductase [Gammaproteobacteria bacterium]|nr:TlpA family protein disulfide reductase [Gammaproteobacteria bacterium]
MLSLFLLLYLFSPWLVYSAQLEPYTEAINTNFSLPDLHGKTQELHDYRGKVVLVNFWASWCLPCIQEMPGMKRLADSLRDQDFVLLTLNTSDSPKRIAEVLRRLQLDVLVLLDHDGKIFKDWQGQVLPTSYLLDHLGRVSYRVDGPADWDDADTVSKIKRLIQSR